MSKPQDYFIALTHDVRSSICVQVNNKVEMKKSKKLLQGLVKRCQTSLENSSTPQEFFAELQSSMKKYTDFTDFFYATPSSIAAAVTQMRFHNLLVEGWEKQYSKIIGTTKGKADVEYDLPAPSLIVSLPSRKRLSKRKVDNVEVLLEIAYTFTDEDTAKLEKLCNHLPYKLINKATRALIDRIEALHNEAIGKVLKDNNINIAGRHESESEDGNKPIFISLDDYDDEDDDYFVPSDEMIEIMKKVNIKQTDTLRQAQAKLFANKKHLKHIAEEMERFEQYNARRKKEIISEVVDEYSGMMPAPGEFVAEA